MWESRAACEISKERWERWETGFWFSTVSNAPSFPEFSGGDKFSLQLG